jgi:hypothetical protein
MGWDDTDNATTYITMGSGLTYTHSTHTLSASGGGGGSPGGADTNVQFNNAGSFDGTANFTWEATGDPFSGGPVVGLGNGTGIVVDGTGTNFGGMSIGLSPNSTASGGAGDINIYGSSVSGTAGPTASSITIQAGDSNSAADGDGTAGSLNLYAGRSSNNAGTPNGSGGAITIQGAGTGDAVGDPAFIQVFTADSFGSASIRVNGGTVSGDPAPVSVGTPFAVENFNSISATTIAGDGGTGARIYMQNITTAPTTSVTGYGILYAEAGALKYRSPGGTVTTIAPN